MGFLKQLMIRVGADVSGVDKELKKASKQVVAFGKDMEKVGATLTKTLTLPILAVGGAAVKLGLEASETEQKFAYAFGNMAGSVKSWSDQLAKSRGLDAFDFRNTAADMQTLAKGFGFTNDAAAEMSKGLTEASYALAEIYETDAATVAENIASGFKGRANALKDFGIVIDDVRLKAWAYTHGIAKMGEELTAAQKAQSTYGIIMASSADEMAEFAKTGSDLATTFKNKLNTALKEFGTRLIETGTFDKLADALMRLLDKAADLAVAFGNLSPQMQDFVIYTGLAVAALGPLLSGVGNLIQMFGNLGLAAAGAGGSMAGAFAIGGAISGAGGWVAGQNRAKQGLRESGMLSDALKDKNGNSFADRLDAEIAARNGNAGAYTGGTNPLGRYAGMDAYYNNLYKNGNITIGGKTNTEAKAVSSPYEDMVKYLEEMNKEAAKSTALDTFKSKIQSLADAMAEAGRQFANWLGMFDRTERQQYSGNRLANRMEGQMRQMQDWVSAMGEIKGKVSGALYRDLLNMGPAAADQIRALLNDGDALSRYESAYTERNRLAGGMGQESAWANYQAQTRIDNQVNNITVVTNDEEKIKAVVVRTLRLAGAR